MPNRNPAATTYFAPAERANPLELERQVKLFSHGLLKKLLDAMINYVLILNRNRQIVFGNAPFLKTMGFPELSETYGARPGEVFSCENSHKAPNGCGTGKECRHCSAVIAILSALKNVQSEERCRIITRKGGALHSLDLQITATPFEQEGEMFVICAMEDITQQQRLRILERTFFHDVLNTAGALRGLAQTLEEDAPLPMREEIKFFHTHLGIMVDEITAHKEFLAAESGEIEPRPVEISADQVLKSLKKLYQGHEIAKGRNIQVECRNTLKVTTDPALLNRILGNLLKNALEAEKEGATITMGCEQIAGLIRFSVSNDTPIPEKYQGLLLKGGFSTKGGNRGVGLYSTRLLTERYLHGRMGFQTGAQTGTIFHVDLPMEPPAP